MKTSRYAQSRQKACLNCSTAKAKCDRRVGEQCTRCRQRNLQCAYPDGRSPTAAVLTSVDDNDRKSISAGVSCETYRQPSSPTLSTDAVAIEQVFGYSQNIGGPFAANVNRLDDSTTLETGITDGFDTLDFSSPELVCPINIDDVQNRWLNTYLPVPGQKIKQYPDLVAGFIYRMLQSYAVVALRGRGVPPFVHHSQTTPSGLRTPLSTCLTLARICDRPLPGSGDIAVDTLKRAMISIQEEHENYNDDLTLLAAFQSYLIYSMILFFKLGQSLNPFLRQAMMNLQNIACLSGRHGLVCSKEQSGARPQWEEWIIAETKRRTLYIMYLFDSVLSTHDGLPTFLGIELHGLLAPANRTLWCAQRRSDWEAAYNLHLADWAGNGLRIDELWPTPAHLDKIGIANRRDRVDRWLENLDEYGTMLYAVTGCTHGA